MFSKWPSVSLISNHPNPFFLYREKTQCMQEWATCKPRSMQKLYAWVCHLWMPLMCKALINHPMYSVYHFMRAFYDHGIKILLFTCLQHQRQTHMQWAHMWVSRNVNSACACLMPSQICNCMSPTHIHAVYIPISMHLGNHECLLVLH